MRELLTFAINFSFKNIKLCLQERRRERRKRRRKRKKEEKSRKYYTTPDFSLSVFDAAAAFMEQRRQTFCWMGRKKDINLKIWFYVVINLLRFFFSFSSCSSSKMFTLSSVFHWLFPSFVAFLIFSHIFFSRFLLHNPTVLLCCCLISVLYIDIMFFTECMNIKSLTILPRGD